MTVSIFNMYISNSVQYIISKERYKQHEGPHNSLPHKKENSIKRLTHYWSAGHTQHNKNINIYKYAQQGHINNIAMHNLNHCSVFLHN